MTVATLAEAMVPDMLEWFGRSLPDEQEAKRIHDYVDSLSAEQRRGLAGTRDRLAILAESDVARLPLPRASRPATTSTCSPPCAAATSSCSASTPTAARCSPGCSPPRSSRTS